ncbi:hypothetical protein N7522_003175 [Penicillium canescens]|uniref:LysM domain-containing protein n=1 Tax=Penicillium canescens TaxID=5083 RepID=A0AAD6N4R0_PENCN|nr:hypothetical protein N7522_003175 [Penicillium canescens]KAJ6030161.1 hypothetical protein N7460_010427 [Penicillium canescens]
MRSCLQIDKYHLMFDVAKTEPTGMASGCIRFYYVEANNDCYDIALDARVALDDFYIWNPAVNSDCSGLQSAVIQFMQIQRQHSMAAGCLRFYDVNGGDSCYNIASDAGVALTDFYSWNSRAWYGLRWPTVF